MLTKYFLTAITLFGIVKSYNWYKPVPDEEGKHGCYIIGLDEVRDENPLERALWFFNNILKFDIDKDVIVKVERIGDVDLKPRMLKVEYTTDWVTRQITIKKYLLNGQDKYVIIKYSDRTDPPATPPPSYFKW